MVQPGLNLKQEFNQGSHNERYIMKKFAQLSSALALSALMFGAPGASASDPGLGLRPLGPRAAHDCLPTVIAGRTLAVNNSFTFDGSLDGLSWSPVLPTNWTILSVSGSGNPRLAGPQGPIVWGPQPETSPIYVTSPITFTYIVQVPANAAHGTYSIHADVLYSIGYPQIPPEPSVVALTHALPDPLVVRIFLPPIPRTQWNLWWQHTCGTPALWSMASTQLVATSHLNCGQVAPQWHIASAADVNHDGRTELRWQHEDGWLATWFMNGTNLTGVAYLNPNHIEPGWRMVGSADIDHDGQADILWQYANGTVAVWYMNGTNRVATAKPVPNNTDPQWKLVGTGHFNGDTQVDLLWQHTDGSLAVWFMNGLNRVGAARLTPPQVDPSWSVAGTYDLNGDGHTEIIWHNTNGRLAYWVMDGTTRAAVGPLSPNPVDPSWHVVGPR